MNSLKEVFQFSRAETIALGLLMSICLIGGGLLLYEHSRQSLPPQLIFESFAGDRDAQSSPSSELKGEIAPPLSASALAPDIPRHSESHHLLLNINTAPAESLALLPFLGKTLSTRIVDYRDKHGNYDSIDQLVAVYGIGPKNIEKIRPFLFCK